VLRAVGAGLIVAAFLICTTADPLVIAIIAWPMLLLV
jgi:hypothetical protein